jgi:hypothetical protein
LSYILLVDLRLPTGMTHPPTTPVANSRLINMSTIEWQIAYPTGNLVATYRGIRIVIKLGETRNPIEIGWFINGQAVESVPVSCDREWPKKLAVDVSDERIPEDDVWQQAEKKDQEPDLS